ncbi:MAG: hypothetical protein ACIAQZ_04230 [Sedimentisphaeraceae bacterium JB056]
MLASRLLGCIANGVPNSIVTGLIVNKKINVKREYYKIARSMCYELFNTGEFYLPNTSKSSDEADGNVDKGRMTQLEGILNFIYKIKRPYDTDTPGHRKYHPNAITKLYRTFLFYKNFHSTQMPVIVCEGKTDIIYLKCALKKLATIYNEFVEISDGGTEFKLEFLNFSNNFRDVFAISTGTSGLKYLIEIYKDYMSKFKVGGRAFPVIIIIDNDEGAEEIKKLLKIKKNDDVEDFYHVESNLYLLIIPKDKDKAIEDLFEPGVLNKEIEGKVFNRKKKLDAEKEYGKIVFAEKVVRENQQYIKFDGFKDVFDRLKAVIDNYNSNIDK